MIYSTRYKFPYWVLITIVFFIKVSTVKSQEIVKDINVSNGDGIRNSIYNGQNIVFDSHLYFTAYEAVEAQLWKTNINTNLTTRVTTINGANISPSSFFIFNDKLLIYDYKNNQICVTVDGNPTTTKVLKSFNFIADFDRSWIFFNGAVIINNKCFFPYKSNLTGEELIVTDGTELGTRILDLNAGTNSSSPKNLIKFGNKLAFSTTINTNSQEIYVTEGEIENTVRIELLPKTTDYEKLTDFYVFDNNLYYTSIVKTSNNFNQHLFQTNGLPSNSIQQITNTNYLEYYEHLNNFYVTSTLPNRTFKLVNGTFTLISNAPVPIPNFVSYSLTYPLIKIPTNVNGDILINDRSSIYKFNGSSFQNIFNSNDGSITNGKYYIKAVRDIGSNEYLIFTVAYIDTGTGMYNTKIWKLNASTSTKTLLATPYENLNTSKIGSNTTFFSDEGNLLLYNGNYYFITRDIYNGIELWKTDKTIAGTVKLMHWDVLKRKTSTILIELILLNNKFYFKKQENSLYENCFTYDTNNGLVSNLTDLAETQQLFELKELNKTSNKIYFTAKSASLGYELYYYENGANVLVKDIAINGTTNSSSNPTNFIEYNNKIYFTANDLAHGNEIWCTDGSSTNTNLLLDISPKLTPPNASSTLDPYFNKLDNSFFGGWVLFRDELYCIINASTLWKINRLGNILKVAEFGNSNDFSTAVFVVHNNNLYFLVKNELYKCDGSTLSKLKTFSGSQNNKIEVFKDKMYFVASTTGDYKLWTSDGTAAGTIEFAAPNVNRPNYLTATENYLFFFANNGTNGSELMRTDGTTTGTILLKDINPGSGDGAGKTAWSSFYAFLGYDISKKGNNVFFEGFESTFASPSLWKSDGTTFGTTKIKQIFGNNILDITQYKNSTFFRGDQRNFWESDGTISNTVEKTNLEGVHKIYKGSDNNLYLQYWGTGSNYGYRFKVYNLETGNLISLPETDYHPTTNTPKILQSLVSNGKLFFDPNTTAYGRELWSIKLPCQNSYSLSDPENQVKSETIQEFNALGTITATNSLNKNSTAIYNAQTFIDLNPGFTMSENTVLKVEIKGCN